MVESGGSGDGVGGMMVAVGCPLVFSFITIWEKHIFMGFNLKIKNHDHQSPSLISVQLFNYRETLTLFNILINV